MPRKLKTKKILKGELSDLYFGKQKYGGVTARNVRFVFTPSELKKAKKRAMKLKF